MRCFSRNYIEKSNTSLAFLEGSARQILVSDKIKLRRKVRDKHFHQDSSTYLRYPLQVNNPKKVIRAAKKEGIELGNWYLSPVAPLGVNYEKVFYKLGSCPVAEKLASQSLNLPTHIQIKEKDALRIVDFLKSAKQAL